MEWLHLAKADLPRATQPPQRMAPQPPEPRRTLDLPGTSPTHIPGHINQPQPSHPKLAALSSHPHRARPAPSTLPSWIPAPCCQHPIRTPALTPQKQRGLSHSSYPPHRSPNSRSSHVLRGDVLCVSPFPSYLYWELPAPPQSTPGEQGAVSQPPHPPGSGRQRWARASSEPLGCLLQLPTASVPGEVSKASDPRTGMRKASSKQSQLPAPAQGGRRGESSRPRGAARLGTAQHGSGHADARSRRGHTVPTWLPGWAAAWLGCDEKGPMALSCPQHSQPSQQVPKAPCVPLPSSSQPVLAVGDLPAQCPTAEELYWEDASPHTRLQDLRPRVPKGPLGQGTARWQHQVPTLASASLPKCQAGSQLVAPGTGMALLAMGGTVGSKVAPCPASVRSPRARACARRCLGLSQPGEQVNLRLPDTWNKIAIP